MTGNGEFSSMLDRFGESEQSESTENSVEKIKQTDQNNIINNFPNYLEHKEHLDKVLEEVNKKLSKKNEGPLSYEIFVEITNNILLNLKRDGNTSDELKNIIISYFGDVFLLSPEKGLIDGSAFNQKVSDFFLKTIEDKIAEQLTQTVNQTAGALDQTAGTLDQTAGALDQTAGTLDQTAGTLDQTAGTLDQTAGTLDQTAGTLDQKTEAVNQKTEAVNQQKGTLNTLDEKTINELKELTKIRETIKNNDTLNQEIRDNFVILIGDFKKFKNEFYRLDLNEVDPDKKELLDKLYAFNLSEQQEKDYLENLYIYGRILANTEEKDRDDYKDFINKFEKLNNNIGIDVASLSKVVQKSIPSIVDVFKKPLNTVEEKTYKTKMSFNASSESVVHNNSVNNFINSGTPSLSDTVKENINEDLKGFQEYLKKNGKKWEDKYLSDDKLSLNMEEINNSTTLTQEEKNKAKEVNEKILDKQNKDKLQKSLIRERIIVNCFKYLSEYFANQGYNENMEIDISTIKFNEETKTLTIPGTLNNNGDKSHVEIHYDLENGAIAMHDYFAAYDKDKKKFLIGKGHNKTEILSGVKMPKYDELEAEAKRVDYHKIMEKTKSVDEYKRMAKSTLNDELGKKFTDQNINKFYIELFNEKNIAEQKILKNMFASWRPDDNKMGNLNLEITEATPNQYDMMMLLHNTLEHYVGPEKMRKFHNNIDELNNKIKDIQENKSNIEDKVMLYLFNKDYSKQSGDKRKKDGKSEKAELNKKSSTEFFDYEINFLSFFDMFAKTSTTGEKIIDMDLFDKFLAYLGKTQAKEEDSKQGTKELNLASYPDSFRDKYENIEEKTLVSENINNPNGYDRDIQEFVRFLEA